MFDLAHGRDNDSGISIFACFSLKVSYVGRKYAVVEDEVVELMLWPQVLQGIMC